MIIKYKTTTYQKVRPLPDGLYCSSPKSFTHPKMAKKLDYEYCKAAPILEWIGNKWALVVLIKISENEPMRFNELYRTIPSVSEKVLSQVLRQLTNDGIIDRRLFPDVPPHVEYTVSDLGKTLLPHIEALIGWGQANFDRIMTNRQKKRRQP